jgi:hypothetical protein
MVALWVGACEIEKHHVMRASRRGFVRWLFLRWSKTGYV